MVRMRLGRRMSSLVVVLEREMRIVSSVAYRHDVMRRSSAYRI